MITLRIRKNILTDKEDEIHHVSCVKLFLFKYFPSWSKTNKIYKDFVSEENLIPLENEHDVKNLENLTGTVYVVCHPAGFGLIGLALIGATVAINLASKNKKAKSKEVENKPIIQSPNNSLSERQNVERLNGRIPDIYGEVISFPDLLMKPYRIYENNVEVEYSWLCIGRGEYDISDVKEGDTLLSTLSNADAEIYGPSTHPGSGSPQTTIGSSISKPLEIVDISSDINNEELPGNVLGTGITGAIFKSGKVNSSNGKVYITIEASDMVASMFIYYRVYNTDANGNRTGGADQPPSSVEILKSGDDLSKKATIEYQTTKSGLVDVEVARVDTVTGNGNEGTLKLISIQGASTFNQGDVGDITTIYTRVSSSEETSNISNRKLNCVAKRKIKQIQNNGTLSAGLVTTSRASDVLAHITLDQYIGNKQLIDIDLQQIYDTHAQVVSTFGDAKAAEFNHTFDDEDLSFEDTFLLVCEAMFCIGFRRGRQLQISHEKSTTVSTILFNSRNKLPNTETRLVSFGNLNDHDGIELEYINQSDGIPEKFYIPSNGSAINPERIKQVGVQSKFQAHFHANRYWNRIQYQKMTVEFDATQEASLVHKDERILVADNTYENVIDGEIISKSGNNLTLSKDVDISTGTWTIFVQNIEGQVESRTVSQGSESNIVVLATALNNIISTTENNYALATFLLVPDTDKRLKAFLLEEKQPLSFFTSRIKAINYDDRYYQNDNDYIGNIIDINGDPV